MRTKNDSELYGSSTLTPSQAAHVLLMDKAEFSRLCSIGSGPRTSDAAMGLPLYDYFDLVDFMFFRMIENGEISPKQLNKDQGERVVCFDQAPGASGFLPRYPDPHAYPDFARAVANGDIPGFTAIKGDA